MNNQQIQGLRYKLQKRFRRLNSADVESFHFILRLFWNFLQSNPVFLDIIHRLEHIHPSAKQIAEKIFNPNNCHGLTLFGNSESEHAAICYFLIKDCVFSDYDQIEIWIGIKYIRPDSSQEAAVNSFITHIVEPFYEYLDENLDDAGMILALLNRYKHRCEWFQRDYLYKLHQSDTKKGEKNLALNLYEYLYEQGIDFSIEPSSASGEVDLVAAQNSEDPLVADAKIFNSDSQSKSYIIKGFRQIYQYTLDYNQPFGYLIVYKTCDTELNFSLSQISQSTPFCSYNNKTIFLLTIDIFPHNKSASKRGKLKSIIISQEDLVEEIKTNIDEPKE